MIGRNLLLAAFACIPAVGTALAADLIDSGIPQMGAAVVLADIDGQNGADIVVVRNQSPPAVLAYLNDGNNNFGSAQIVASITAGIAPMIAGAFDSNSGIDLCVAGGNLALQVLSNNGTGTFGSPVLMTPFMLGSAIVAGDFDDDGDQDIFGVQWGEASAGFFRNNAGTFASAVSYPLTGHHGAFAHLYAADVDHDGELDVIGADNNGVVWLRNTDGNATFSAVASLTPAVESYGFDVGELDGAAGVDFAVVSQLSKTVVAGLNSGTGTFTPTTVATETNAPFGLAIVDIVGDSGLDIVYSVPIDGKIRVMENVNGVFGEPTDLVVGLPDAGRIVAVDSDGDGDKDLAVITKALVWPGSVWFVENPKNDATAARKWDLY